MKKLVLLWVLCLNVSVLLGQEYKNWEKHEIEGFYILAKSKAEAKNYTHVLREGSDYYVAAGQKEEIFPSGVSKRVTPKLYKLKDSEVYILFSLPPFLFESDEGVIEAKESKGIFYKKPTQ